MNVYGLSLVFRVPYTPQWYGSPWVAASLTTTQFASLKTVMESSSSSSPSLSRFFLLHHQHH